MYAPGLVDLQFIVREQNGMSWLLLRWNGIWEFPRDDTKDSYVCRMSEYDGLRDILSQSLTAW